MIDRTRVDEATRFIIRGVKSREGGGRRRPRTPPGAARRLVDSLDRRVLSDGDILRPGSALERARRAVLSSLPADPLRGAGAADRLAPIDVFIPMHEKDAWLAHLAVASVNAGSVRPLRSITLGVPDAQKVPDWASDYNVEVLRDSEVLALLGDGHSLATLPGWFLQQVLKLSFALRSDAPTLIHDADTVLLRPRVWSAAGRQILPLRWKGPRQFAHSTSQLLGRDGCLTHASSVTHHQLMTAEVLREALGSGNTAVACLTAWVGSHGDGASPSEYQLYGSQLRLVNPKGWVPAGWHHANGKVTAADVASLPALSPEEALETVSRLRAAFPGLFGLSLHARR